MPRGMHSASAIRHCASVTRKRTRPCATRTRGASATSAGHVSISGSRTIASCAAPNVASSMRPPRSTRWLRCRLSRLARLRCSSARIFLRWRPVRLPTTSRRTAIACSNSSSWPASNRPRKSVSAGSTCSLRSCPRACAANRRVHRRAARTPAGAVDGNRRPASLCGRLRRTPRARRGAPAERPWLSRPAHDTGAPRAFRRGEDAPCEPAGSILCQLGATSCCCATTR